MYKKYLYVEMVNLVNLYAPFYSNHKIPILHLIYLRVLMESKSIFLCDSKNYY
jgi:uncharacterized protein YhhL (DUF1145 family)